jgi:hypothetical protein
MPKGWDHNDLSSFAAAGECELCDRSFLLRHPDQKYCSSPCADRAQRIRRRQAVLPPGHVRCGWCAHLIVDDYNGRAKFCSVRCRALAWNARHRQIVLADRELADRRCAAPGCDTPVSVHDLRQIYCSVECRIVVKNLLRALPARRTARTATPTAMIMLDPTVPEVTSAMTQIRAQVAVIEIEEPDWPPRQVLQEAPRRGAQAMVVAIEAAGRKKPAWTEASPSLSGPGMPPQIYYRRWEVWLRGKRIGEVLAATERAACLRAMQTVQSQSRGPAGVARAPGEGPVRGAAAIDCLPNKPDRALRRPFLCRSHVARSLC